MCNSLTINDFQKAFNYIENDDDLSLEILLIEYDNYNPSIPYVKEILPKYLHKCMFLINIAAYYGAMNCLQYLFRKNPRINHYDSRGRGIGHYAVYSNNIDIIKLIINQGFDIDVPSKENIYPSHIAAKRGLLSICQYLWANGFKMNEITNNGFAPIHFALMNHYFLVVDFLMNAGTNIFSLDSKVNMYCVAIKQDRQQMFDFLIKNHVPCFLPHIRQYPLHEAVSRGYLHYVFDLLDYGIDIEFPNQKGEYPIHVAASRNNDEILIALLESGCAIDILNKKGQTPMHIASKYGHYSIVNLLLDYGADINITDSHGMTPMNYAFISGHCSITEIFYDLGQDNDNISPEAPKSKKHTRNPKWGNRTIKLVEVE